MRERTKEEWEYKALYEGFNVEEWFKYKKFKLGLKQKQGG